MASSLPGPSGSWRWVCGNDSTSVWSPELQCFQGCFTDVANAGLNITAMVLLLALAHRLSRRELRQRLPARPQTLIEKALLLELTAAMMAVVAVLRLVYAAQDDGWSELAAHRPHVLIATVSRALVWLLALAVLHSNAAISAAMGRAGRVPLLLLLVWTLQTAGMVFNSVRISTSSMEHGYFYPEDSAVLAATVLQCLFWLALALLQCTVGDQHPLSSGLGLEEPLLPDTEAGHTAAPYFVGTSYWSQLSFSWVAPLLARGTEGPLAPSQLFHLEPELEPRTCSKRLWEFWTHERVRHGQASEAGQPSFLASLWHAYGGPYVMLGVIKLFNDALNFAGPLLLSALIRYLNDPQKQDARISINTTSMAFGMTCAVLLGLTAVLKGILNTQYSWRQGRIACKLRAGITCCVFKKSLMLSPPAMSEHAPAGVQTLMAIDADRVVNLCASAHELWSLPLQIIIALCLLFTQVEYAALAGLAVVLLLIPLNRWLALKIQATSNALMSSKDLRLQRCAELLSGIRQIKTAAWEPAFAKRVGEPRASEMRQLAILKYLDAMCVYFWAVTSGLFALTTFGLYVALGNQLTPEIVFTSLALSNVLIAPLNSFPMVLNGCVEAIVSVHRLQRFLLAPETKASWAYALPAPSHGLLEGATLRSASSERERRSSGAVSRASSGGALAEADLAQPLLPAPGLSPRLPASTSAECSASWSRSPRPQPSAEASAHTLGHTALPSEGTRTLASTSSSKTASADSRKTASPPQPPPRTASVTLTGFAVTPQAPASRQSPVRSASGLSLALRTSQSSPRTVAVRTDVRISGASFGWSASPDSAFSNAAEGQQLGGGPVLERVDLVVPRGSLAVVSGVAGSGKSTLLRGILGDPQLLAGKVAVHGSLAIVTQQPWLESGSIRHNILFGRAMDEAKYEAAVESCGLSLDLRAMPAGDATLVGEQGCRLSGGQRMRVALARALYQDRDIYVMDDIFASVDAHVAEWLLQHVLLGALASKTRIIGTNYGPCIAQADRAITLQGGRAVHSSEQALREAALQSGNTSWQNESRDSSSAAAAGPSSSAAPACWDRAGPLPAPEAAADVLADEERGVGHVSSAVYMAYAKAVGPFLVVVVLASLTLMQATRNGADLWLSYWVQQTRRHGNASAMGPSWARSFLSAPVPRLVQPSHLGAFATAPGAVHQAGLAWHFSTEQSVHLFLSIYFGIALLNSVFTLVRAFSFASGGLIAAREMHNKLLMSVLHAPVSWFDASPTGRTLNRFSSDVGIIDDQLPFIANIFLANAFTLAGLVLVLLYTQPYIAIACLLLAVLYRWLQVYYQQTSRELRRLLSIARSPVSTQFAEVTAGATTIRAFDAQPRFAAINEHLVACTQRAAIAGVAAAQWLALRLQLIAAVIVFSVALLAVLDTENVLPSSTSRRFVNVELIALSLAYALPISSVLNGLLTASAETEMEMVAVERVLQYSSIRTEDESAAVASAAQPGGTLGAADDLGVNLAAWPFRGSIMFQHVHLRYTPPGQAALENLDLRIEAGEKLGICGRTGAGKSTMVAALLRLVDVQSGAILVDGIDVSMVPLRQLRASIGVVSQQTFLFEGTVRENLDPMGEYSERELLGVLKAVMLWDVLAGVSFSQAKAADVAAPRPGASSSCAAPGASSSIPIGSCGGRGSPGRGGLAATPPRSPAMSIMRAPMERGGLPWGTSTPPLSPKPGFFQDASMGPPPSPSPGGAVLMEAGGRGVPQLPSKRRAGPSQGAGLPSAASGAEQSERAAGGQGRTSRQAEDSNIGMSQLLSVLGRRPGVAATGQESGSGRRGAMGFSSALLSLQLGEAGAGLSLGQQQLLCLARLLLKRPKIVVLDEATAHMDSAAAAVMHRLVASQFASATVVHIAHRLDSILTCDRVAVMEAGRVAELGAPADLLKLEGSRFAALWRASQRQER